MEEHCALVDADFIVVLLQFNSCSKYLTDPKHSHHCANKCYG
jgi:hypothetical protein